LEEPRKTFEKKLILVSGSQLFDKTTLALNIANNLENCAYIDKKDLVRTSNAAFRAVNELYPYDGDIECDGILYNRSEIADYETHSLFFKQFIRNPTYDSLRDIIIKAIQFSDAVVINAPYSSELKREVDGCCREFDELHHFLEKENCEFVVVIAGKSDIILKSMDHHFYDDPELQREKLNSDIIDEKIRQYEEYKSALIENEFYSSIRRLDNSRNIDRVFYLEEYSREQFDNSFYQLMNSIGVKNIKPYDRYFRANTVY